MKKTIFFTLLLTGATCYGQINPGNLGLAVNSGPFSGSADVSSLFGFNAGTLTFTYAGIHTLGTTAFNTGLSAASNSGNYQVALNSSVIQDDGQIVSGFDATVRHGANLVAGGTDGFTALDGNTYVFDGTTAFDNTTSGTDFQVTNNTTEAGNTGSITFTASDVTAVNVTGFSLDTGNNNNFFLDLDNFTLESVPEPSSTALLGLGALGILARRKR